MADQQPKSISDFEQWMRGAGIVWNDELIKIRAATPGCGGDGWGVFALADIEESQQLCVIPKRSILSIKTTGIADIIEAERLKGGLPLTFAAAYERARGEASPWYGYFESMPEQEYIPIFWGEDELKYLKGTDIEKRAGEDRDLTKDDYETLITPILEKYSSRFAKCNITLQDFQNAASLVGSRAFYADDHHGDALVPLADVFNHKASIVALSNEYEVEGLDSDGSSEPELEVIEESRNESNGQASGSHCASDQRNANNGDDPKDDQDDQNGDERAAVHGCHAPDDPALRLEIAICSRELDGEDVLEIIAASPVPQNSEVHNTYGELGNADLLHKYGFCLKANPFNTVTLEKKSMVANARGLVGDSECAKRVRFLKEHSYILKSASEPFEVLPNGVITSCIAVGLKILTAEKKAFKGWKSVVDALGPEQEHSKFEAPVAISELSQFLGIPGLSCLRRMLEHRKNKCTLGDVQDEEHRLEELKAQDTRSQDTLVQMASCLLRRGEKIILNSALDATDNAMKELIQKAPITTRKHREAFPERQMNEQSRRKRHKYGTMTVD